MKPVVIGSRDCAKTHKLCDWLTRLNVDFDYAERSELPHAMAVYPLPRLVANGKAADDCGIDEAAGLLGLQREPGSAGYDVVIIGGGPAGLSAAIHSAAEGLSTLLIEAYAYGGQASSSQHVENYAGFESGILGRKLTWLMAKQAMRLGAELIVSRTVTKLTVAEDCVNYSLALDSGTEVSAKTVILAMGSQYRLIKTGDDGKKTFIGTGVYYGMTDRDVKECGNNVVIVGAGNSAGQAALAFAAEGKQVTLLVRHGSLADHMSAYLVNEIDSAIKRQPNIDVWYDAEIVNVEGVERLNEVHVMLAGDETVLPCTALFVFAGNQPETNWLPESLQRDSDGYILTDVSLQTNLPGLFAVGDVRNSPVKRIATAAADGAAAIALAWKLVKQGGTKCELRTK